MFSQNPSTQDRVPGSKVRRADTGGQTHADERGSAKSICATGTQVHLVSRNASVSRNAFSRADAAAKANGSPSSPRDSPVVRMEVGKENIAPPEVEVPKVRGGELHCCLRNRPSFPRDDFRARQPRRRRVRGGELRCCLREIDPRFRATTSARVSHADAAPARPRASAASAARLVALPHASGRRRAPAAA